MVGDIGFKLDILLIFIHEPAFITGWLYIAVNVHDKSVLYTQNGTNAHMQCASPFKNKRAVTTWLIAEKGMPYGTQNSPEV